MKVICTLDYYDGTKSKISKPVELDSINTMSLRLTLCEAGVCSLTITRLDGLPRIMEEMKK